MAICGWGHTRLLLCRAAAALVTPEGRPLTDRGSDLGPLRCIIITIPRSSEGVLGHSETPLGHSWYPLWLSKAQQVELRGAVVSTARH